MDYQDRYDELDNIVRTLDILVDDINDKYYIDLINDIKFEAENELEEVAEKLQEEQRREERQQEKDYWKEAIWWKKISILK
mgnify:CR=1 FL=1